MKENIFFFWRAVSSSYVKAWKRPQVSRARGAETRVECDAVHPNLPHGTWSARVSRHVSRARAAFDPRRRARGPIFTRFSRKRQRVWPVFSRMPRRCASFTNPRVASARRARASARARARARVSTRAARSRAHAFPTRDARPTPPRPPPCCFGVPHARRAEIPG